jgi:hypothetical protein
LAHNQLLLISAGWQKKTSKNPLKTLH